MVRTRWTALEPNRKRLYVVIGVSGAIAAGAAITVLGQTPYSPVLTGLSPASSGQVTQALTSSKIPYRLSQGGTTVEVPTAEADQARVDLAMQNLPSNGQVGYQNLTQLSSAGMTQQQFSLAQLSMLEQDLSSTLSTFQGVQAANVQIAVPPQSIWAAPTTSGAKASVYLKMPGGYAPPASEVAGVVALVSHAVPGLKASDVSVVNQMGQLLSQPPSPAQGTPASVLQEEEQIDTTDEAQLRSMLEPIMGPNNLAVSVNAAVSPQTVRTTKTLPLAGQPSSVSTQSTVSSGGGGTTVPAGLSGNAPPTYPAATGGTSSYHNKTTTTQYTVGREVQTTVGLPATITALSASVVVNQHAYPLTAARAATLRSLVGAALGIPKNLQASNIVVTAQPFALVPVQAGAKPPAGLSMIDKALALFLLLIMVLVVLWLRRRKQTRTASSPIDATGVLEPDQEALPGQEIQVDAPPPGLLAEVGKLAQQSPTDAAALIAQWLEESP